ncbi:NADP-dependent oxidoreductase [Hyphomicrobiales bacterium BP6-180914]|uniref:NADP-dependent oxidoreductase n=1 Tax=Lichenifustis flavocetrariae TaxID=2949735 RepID=A0AA42CMY4_9HYPH|nr:NADP-dependent oxidoreductase [Lichenifustis flavocetrariae]
MPPPPAGQVRVQNLWMSVDPYMRGRMMTRESYVPPFRLGEPLEGGAIGRVDSSACEGFAPGDLVQSMLGWREAFNAPPSALTKVPTTGLPPEALLGVAGLPGLTAFLGVTKVVKLQAGEVVFVSAASGAVGSAACQIAKAAGATVIGSAGGAEKCAFLREIGVDQVVDYKVEKNLAAALAAAAPQGIDAYFDNVGGVHLDAALQSAKPFARFALCGMISQYNQIEGTAIQHMRLVVTKRLRLQGFIVSDDFDMMPQFVDLMAGWVASGAVKIHQTVEHGIENAPAAFLKLFSGGNIGKMLVRVST